MEGAYISAANVGGGCGRTVHLLLQLGTVMLRKIGAGESELS